MIKAVPTSPGDFVAPPRPDRGTTSLQFPAPLPPIARIPAARSGVGADAVPVRAAAALPADPVGTANSAGAADRAGASDAPDLRYVEGVDGVPSAEARGCLFALSQPPLMLFLTVIGALIGLGAAWDLLFV